MEAEDSLEKRLKALLEEKKTLKELYAANLAYGKSIGTQAAEIDKINRAYGHQSRLQTDITKRLAEGVRYKVTSSGKLTLVAATEREILATKKILANLEDGQLDIVRGRVQATADLAKAELMYETGLKDSYAEQLLQLKAALELGAITKANYDTSIKKLLKDQEEVDLIEKKKELISETAAALSEIREEAEKYTKGLEKALATARAIGNDPKVFGAFLLGQAVDKAGELVESFEHFHHLGLTAGQSIDAMQKSFSLMSMVGLADNAGVIEGMVQSYGSMNALTNDQIDTVGALAHKMGVAGQEAFAMVDAFSKMPGETAESAINAAEFTKHLATANGIAPGAVTKEIAQNSEAMALFSAGGAKGFAKAAIETKKLGVELTTAVSMSKGLLDFESSITKQMEASVLLGKEINLDKARELALNGDLEGATKEVLKNIGSQAEFEKMNVLQKQALAEATGMTVEQLAKAIDAQEEYNKYHGEEASTWMNILGYATDYGSKVGGFLKENGVLLLATVQFLTMGNGLQLIQNGLLAAKNTLLGVGKGIAMAISLIYSKQRREDLAHWLKQKAQWAAEKIHYAWLKTQAAFGVKGAEGRAGALKRVMDKKSPVDTLQDKAVDKLEGVTDKVSDAGKEMGGPGMMAGFKANMKLLAGGLKAMAHPKVLAGALVTALAGPALVVALPSIPFLLFMGLTPLAQLGTNFMNLAIGLEFMGGGKVALGSLNTMLFAAAAVVGLAGIPFMITTALLGAATGSGLIGLASGLTAMGNPIVAFGAAILAGVLLSAGASFLLFGAGVGLAAAGMSLLVASLKDVPFENLLALPLAFMGMAAGLTALTVAGYAALPILGALTMLGVVAPALSGLGDTLSGLLGGGESDTMDELLTEIRGLRSDIQKGGVVNMDGQKVGEVVALALNVTGG